jgi:hypothetical protein
MTRPTALLGISAILLVAGGGWAWQKAAQVQAAASDPPARMVQPTSGREAAPKEPAVAKANGFPNTSESLDYAVKWPTGLTLGEAHLRAGQGEKGWQFDFSLDASIPGFAVSDHYHSRANAELCSLELEKQSMHGQRKSHERTTFDYHAATATRKTLVEGGGHTDINISECAHDGLGYLYYARRELALGHGVPPAQEVLFGATYYVRLEYAGAQDVTVAGKRRQADRVLVHLRGPASDASVEVLFDRDPARTPLIIKAPFALGTFSMELVR